MVEIPHGDRWCGNCEHKGVPLTAKPCSICFRAARGDEWQEEAKAK